MFRARQQILEPLFTLAIERLRQPFSTALISKWVQRALTPNAAAVVLRQFRAGATILMHASAKATRFGQCKTLRQTRDSVVAVCRVELSRSQLPQRFASRRTIHQRPRAPLQGWTHGTQRLHSNVSETAVAK
jgi:hypothetical protein